MKKVGILGSTGSIGVQTLDVIRRNGDIQVTGLSAGRNIDKLEEQVREFHPSLVAVWEEEAAKTLQTRLADMQVKVLSGMEGLLALSTMEEMDLLVTAVVGMIGIRPTLAAIEAGKNIALANKETLVTAGHLIMPAAKAAGVEILPVDSEHSAIFQVLHGENRKEIHKLLITASGGPFRGRKREELSSVTKADALRHPNWTMGAKITIDSATLVNKGLEVMEARWLFGVSLDQIQVVVQPKSIIHSMVEFADGAVLAQLGTPDMRVPISYAVYFPQRLDFGGDRLDFRTLKEITFEEPDMETFRGLPMAIDAARRGGTYPTIFNAANEAAVALFLEDKIRFLDIYDLIQGAIEVHQGKENPSLEEILLAEKEARDYVARHTKG
ncbi:MAG: 1-deoxy-D-xylulose-5-phosphate reductoisomerase [Blautia sp.]|nr:1-deoxy-D-xylulose-5-phosphate reductoisomerase [Blautia sp.]